MPRDPYHVDAHQLDRIIETLQLRLLAREQAYTVFELAVKQGRVDRDEGAVRLEELQSTIQFTTVNIAHLKKEGE